MTNDVRTTVYLGQELSGTLLLAVLVVVASGIVYLLSLAVLCVCGFLCGRCSLRHKECRHQHSGTAALCNADGQPHHLQDILLSIMKIQIATIHPCTHNIIRTSSTYKS